MTELESEIKKDIQPEQNFQKVINKSQMLEDQPTQPSKTNYCEKIKKWFINIKNQTINYLECDQLLDSQQDDTQPLFQGGYKKKFAQNFYESYSERETKFAYTYQEVLEQRQKQQQRKSKNLWTQFKRLICCQGGNQMDELDELYIQRKQKTKFKKDPQYTLNETKEAFFEMNSNRSEKEHKKQRKMIKMRKMEEFQMQDNFIADMEEFEFDTPGQKYQNQNKETIITKKQEQIKIQTKQPQQKKLTELKKIHVKQKINHQQPIHAPIQETKEDLVFNNDNTDTLPNQSKIDQSKVVKKKKRNNKITAVSKLDEQLGQVVLQQHKKQEVQRKSPREETHQSSKIEQNEQKKYETVPMKHKKRKIKKMQQFNNDELNDNFEIQLNEQTKQSHQKQFFQGNSLQGEQLNHRYKTHDLKPNNMSHDFIKQKKPIDANRGQKKKRKKILELKEMKQEVADLEFIDFDD